MPVAIRRPARDGGLRRVALDGHRLLRGRAAGARGRAGVVRRRLVAGDALVDAARQVQRVRRFRLGHHPGEHDVALVPAVVTVGVWRRDRVADRRCRQVDDVVALRCRGGQPTGVGVGAESGLLADPVRRMGAGDRAERGRERRGAILGIGDLAGSVRHRALGVGRAARDAGDRDARGRVGRGRRGDVDGERRRRQIERTAGAVGGLADADRGRARGNGGDRERGDGAAGRERERAGADGRDCGIARSDRHDERRAARQVAAGLAVPALREDEQLSRPVHPAHVERHDLGHRVDVRIEVVRDVVGGCDADHGSCSDRGAGQRSQDAAPSSRSIEIGSPCRPT